MQSLLELQVALGTQPYAMTPEALASLASLSTLDVHSFEGIAGRRLHAAGRTAARGSHVGRTQVIPVRGAIDQRPGFLEYFGLGTSYATISNQLSSGLSDSSVDRICLEFDSPGGTSFGVDELASEIRTARAQKPIVGVVNSLCGSAAYWLASQCTELYCTPGGTVGSIGVYVTHEDTSDALEMAGISVTVVSAGKHKVEQWGPLGVSARSHMQSQVDFYFQMFKNAVALGRRVSVGKVDRDFGQGRMLQATDAQRVGMVDGIATLADVLSKRAKPSARSATSRAYGGLPPALAEAMRYMDALEDQPHDRHR